MEDKKYLFCLSPIREKDKSRENDKDGFGWYYIDKDNLRLLSKTLDSLVGNNFKGVSEPINIMLDKYIDHEFIEKVPLSIDVWDAIFYTQIEFIFDGLKLDFTDEACLNLVHVLDECKANDACDEDFLYKSICLYPEYW